MGFLDGIMGGIALMAHSCVVMILSLRLAKNVNVSTLCKYGAGLGGGQQ